MFFFKVVSKASICVPRNSHLKVSEILFPAGESETERETDRVKQGEGVDPQSFTLPPPRVQNRELKRWREGGGDFQRGEGVKREGTG